jgi:hypothetical protein
MQKRDSRRLQKIYDASRLKEPYLNMSIFRRIYVYQNERVPIIALFTIGLLLYAGVAVMTQNTLDWTSILLATTVSTLYFIQIRLADEPKDFEHDEKYHSQRPVQRGLVTLKELLTAKRIVILLFILAVSFSGSVEILLLAVFQQAVFYVTQNEFFVRDWLRRHFFIYQISHYVQLLTLGWLTTSLLNIGDLGMHVLYFWYVVAMSAPIELSRTIGGRDSRVANDRYSHKLGVIPALLLFLLSVLLVVVYTFILVHDSGREIHPILIAVGVVAIVYACFRYLNSPTEKNALMLTVSAIIIYSASAGTLIVS